MTLPNFLGIGVAKAGTTWLTALLATHPDVYLPTKLKDIRYFNNYYDKGSDWYQSFFPSAGDAKKYKAIGEFSAYYFYDKDTPQRIAKDLDKPQLLLMLRNPIDRLWSNYLHISRLRNYQEPFERFIEDHPGAYWQSFYAVPLKRYQGYFGPDQLLTLIYEEVFEDVEATQTNVANHLNIDPSLFAEEAGSQVVNKGFLPRNRTLYALVARGAAAAQSRHFYWPVYMAKKMGVKRLISSKDNESRSMSPETRHRLRNEFADDISEVETLLQKDLSQWRV